MGQTCTALIGCIAAALLAACSSGASRTPAAPPNPASSSSVQPSTSAGASSSAAGSDPAASDIVAGKGRVDADVVVVALDNLKFDRPEYQGKADLTLGYVDGGTQLHTLLIEGKNGFKLAVAHRGESKISDVQLGHGSYTIYCDLPGHRQAGMEAKLVIP
jgi:plastocyanin